MTWQPRLRPGCPQPVTLEDYYDLASDETVYGDSGICRHLPYLESLVQPGDIIVELGMGGGDQSTIAFLAGRPSMMYSYDINEPASVRTVYELAGKSGIGFQFIQGSTTKINAPFTADGGTGDPWCPCQILFIDTLHDADTVAIELERFAPLCSRTIVFHDVVAFGRHGQFRDGEDQGINLAIAEFLFTHPEWRVERYVTFDNGLLTLRKDFNPCK